jgi:1,4-dihydroxy-2-naphthoate octaprenyltransferase
MPETSIKNISKLESWILASRPRTLPAAVVPVMVGSALAIHENNFNLPAALIALVCSLLIQIGTNFANDLYDFLSGADTKERKGPVRALAAGLISENEMKIGVIITFGLAFFLGLYLVSIGGMLILVIGILSIIAGLAYTTGPYPLAYNGLGDIFVFIFFGIVGTMGTFYIHTLQINILSFLASIPVGALITNILIVNNYRDTEEDRAAGKRTLAVILGKEFTRVQYIIFIILSYLSVLLIYLFYIPKLWVFLPLVTIPVAIKLIMMIFSLQGSQLNKLLELSAKFSALYGLLFSLGILI